MDNLDLLVRLAWLLGAAMFVELAKGSALDLFGALRAPRPLCGPTTGTESRYGPHNGLHTQGL